MASNFTYFKRFIQRKDIYVFSAQGLPDPATLLKAPVSLMEGWMEHMPTTGETWPAEEED